MNINSDGHLVIDINDIFDNLPEDSIIELIERLSCSEQVIKHVADQLLEGWTENGYHGSISSGLNQSTEICRARDNIAKGAGDVASKRILELEGLVKSAEELTQAGWDAYHKAIRDGLYQQSLHG